MAVAGLGAERHSLRCMCSVLNVRLEKRVAIRCCQLADE